MKPIKNARQLLKQISGESTTEKKAQELISHYAYKYTNCGAWASFSKDGVKVGSIIEGCDIYTQTYLLEYPFTKKEYFEALDMVENEASEIWIETHGCEDCGDENEIGYISINPRCKTCKGEGTIL